MNDDRLLLPWFPCEPGKLLGALSAMKPHVGYTYWIVCLRIYEVGGPCPDSLDAIARRTGYNKRVVSDALDVLFRAEKLVREPGGITNPYAADVLAAMKARHGRLSQSGQEGAERRWRKPKGKQRTVDGQAKQTPMGFDADLQLDLHKKEESKEVVPAAKTPRGKHRLPPDWVPGDEGFLYARQQGFDQAEAERLFHGFREHHIGRGNKWEKWSMAWQRWCRNEVEFRRQRGGSNKQQGRSMFEIATGKTGGNE